MWVRTNPNPKHKHVPDCVIRALAIVLNKTWYQVYDDLYLLGRWDASVMCHDEVWGHYLHMHGYEQFMLPKACPQCVTIKEFTAQHERALAGTGSHVERSVPGLLAKRIRPALWKLALIRTAGAVFTCGSGFFLPERSTEGSKQL